MGHITAMDFAEMDIDIDLALTWHLRSNHYPPVPLSMIEPCKAAIDAYWEGDCDVCGEAKPVTEARDYAYLITGIRKLSRGESLD